MLKNYTMIYILALVAFIESIPINITESIEENIESNENVDKIYSREIVDKIDGVTHHIKSIGINYQQRINNNQCFVEYDNQLLSENSIIKIRKKLFRVEDCLLERVYHACGPNLILMLSVVCRVVEQHKQTNSLTNFKRQINFNSIFQSDFIKYKTKRVITESCCENLCSISELTRYCHE